MKYKLIDEQGDDLIIKLYNEINLMKQAYDIHHREIEENRNDIRKLHNNITEQSVLIDNLKDCIIKLQSETISAQKSTLVDIIKNTFKKKPNIKQSVVEIDD